MDNKTAKQKLLDKLDRASIDPKVKATMKATIESAIPDDSDPEDVETIMVDNKLVATTKNVKEVVESHIHNALHNIRDLCKVLLTDLPMGESIYTRELGEQLHNAFGATMFAMARDLMLYRSALEEQPKTERIKQLQAINETLLMGFRERLKVERELNDTLLLLTEKAFADPDKGGSKVLDALEDYLKKDDYGMKELRERLNNV